MRELKYFLLEKSSPFIASAGVMLLILAAAIWYGGARQSRDVRIMAENLGKDYAGGGWYPADGTTDYDLEARIVGQEGWFSNAINVGYGDQIELRLRIVSGNGLAESLVKSAVTYDDTQLTDTTKMDENGRKVFNHYESPDDRHVFYIPAGVYTVESNVWSSKTGAYTFGMTYSGTDDFAYRKILIVPPNSEIPFRMVLGCAIAGLVCLLVAALIAGWYHHYERRCYAWG